MSKQQATKRRVSWEARLEELQAYKTIHGNCRVPGNKTPLGNWVAEQRKKYRKGQLSPAKETALNGIGFEWRVQVQPCTTRIERSRDKYDAAFEKMFVKLEAFVGQFGHCRVPQKYKADPKLGNWVMNLKGRKASLSDQKIDRLNNLGIEWASKKSPPEPPKKK